MRAASLICLLVLPAAPAAAQTPLAVPPPAQGTFLTRAAFNFGYAVLESGDPRFGTIAHFGADLDLIDYATGRLTFVAAWEGVLGSERRPFDLNHTNYVLESAFTRRIKHGEVAAVFHHVSRHLSDRENPATIAWNVLLVRATRTFAAGASSLDAQIEVGRTLQHTFVDYRWTSDLRLALHRPISGRVTVYGTAAGGLIGIDRAISDRERLCGARFEGGVHFDGQVSGVDLYVGYERRIDAYPLDRHRERWFEVGFRVGTR